MIPLTRNLWFLLLAIVAGVVPLSVPSGARADEPSSISEDWASSTDFASEQERAAQANNARLNYLLRERLLGNSVTVNVDGDYNATTNNTGPITGSNATNIGQQTNVDVNVGDNSMTTVTATVDQDLDTANQEADSTVTSTGNTSNVNP